MSTIIFLQIFFVCLLGAMSPGPSMVVVINNAVFKNRYHGILTSIGHGIGIGIYAFFAVLGIGIAIETNLFLFNGIKILSVIFLIFLGIKSIINKTKSFERVCVASFNSERLKRVRSMYPDMCISMGPNEVIKTFLSSFGLYNGSIDGDCLQIPIRYYGVRVVTKRFVNFLKSKGLKIMVWTINDVKTFKYLIDLEVDGIITDRPKLLFETLQKF